MVLEDSMVSTTTEEDESDPFWDPAGPIDIGRGYIPLKHAAYRFALKRPVTFVSENQPIGTVQVVTFLTSGLYRTLSIGRQSFLC